MKKIAVMGAGAFGFAIAHLISENHLKKKIFVYDINKSHIEHIRKTGMHPVFHKGVQLGKNVIATTSCSEALESADLVVLAIPSKFLRKAIVSFKEFIPKKVVFLNLAKGLEAGTNKRVSEIIDECLKGSLISYEKCSLSGGMIAAEVTLKSPLCADLASCDKNTAKAVARLLWSDYLRIETTTDIVGVELAGAFKNVIAIGAGVFDGLGYGESSKSAFVSLAAKQISQLAVALGAKKETFGPGSQAWFGDLMTTCFGKSRNRLLGELIGKGMNVGEAVEHMLKNNMSIEGYLTAKAVNSMLAEERIKAPLIRNIYRLLYGSLGPEKFIRDFITH